MRFLKGEQRNYYCLQEHSSRMAPFQWFKKKKSFLILLCQTKDESDYFIVVFFWHFDIQSLCCALLIEKMGDV